MCKIRGAQREKKRWTYAWTDRVESRSRRSSSFGQPTIPTPSSPSTRIRTTTHSLTKSANSTAIEIVLIAKERIRFTKPLPKEWMIRSDVHSPSVVTSGQGTTADFG